MICTHCGKEYEGKTERSQFCSPKCRVYASRSVTKPVTQTVTQTPNSDKVVTQKENSDREVVLTLKETPVAKVRVPEEVAAMFGERGFGDVYRRSWERFVSFKKANPGDTYIPNWLKGTLSEKKLEALLISLG